MEHKIALCLPTRNEIDSIHEVVKSLRELNQFHLFICDALSTDGTREAASQLGLQILDRKGLGKGYGVQTALEWCNQNGFEYLALVDCDSSYPVNAFPELITGLDNHDMVVGARRMNDIGWFHRIGNLIHISAINLLFGSQLRDINSGMRILNVERFLPHIDASNFDIEAQITCVALKQKMKIKEIRISYGDRKGQSKIVLKDAFEVLWRIVYERFFRKVQKPHDSI